jgi:dTDP-4-amino-4,6-dideoxygalactose transaminase
MAQQGTQPSSAQGLAGEQPILVTRAFLPPRKELDAFIDRIYGTHVLTNNGPLHRELEETLKARFQVQALRLMANGTLAIQLALRALGVTGRVITTPYSYVATTSAILWEGCEPVFADVKRDTLCIDPAAIEPLIDDRTTAIVATHVYGTPCDVEAIETIAKRHGLKVIYDAAHAFDVEWKGRSILQWGDASTLSLHATKLFHTVEGGAVVLQDHQADERLRLLRSFGHIGDEHFCLGMNAKMSELHAAMGLAILPHLPMIKARRAQACATYDAALQGLGLERPVVPEGTAPNHGYYALLAVSEGQREHLLRSMAAEGVHARRYFFPSLDTLPYVTGPTCPVSRDAAARALCLPLHAGLDQPMMDRVMRALRNALDAWKP